MTTFTRSESWEFCNQLRFKSLEEIEAVKDRLLAECDGDIQTAISRGTSRAISFAADLLCACSQRPVYPAYQDYREKKDARALTSAEGGE